MFSATNELVIPPNRLNLVGRLAGAVAFVGLGVLMLIVEMRQGIVAKLMGLVTIGFFGAVAASIVKHLLTAGPAVIIDSRGITDNSSGVSVGFIAWDEVAEVREYTFQHQTFLGIEPKDLNAILARLPKWKRTAIRGNVKLGAAPINISQLTLGVKVSDLIRQIDARFRSQRW